MSELIKFLEATIVTREIDFETHHCVLQILRPRVVCNDGFSISIQASETHYCEPRQSKISNYKSVELGYPNFEEELIKEYAEEGDDLTGTVYGWVPVEIVDKLLEKHGGIDYLATMANFSKIFERYFGKGERDET